MRAIEKFIGINMSEVQQTLPALKIATARMVKDYHETTHPKLKMLDGLMVVSLVTFLI